MFGQIGSILSFHIRLASYSPLVLYQSAAGLIPSRWLTAFVIIFVSLTVSTSPVFLSVSSRTISPFNFIVLSFRSYHSVCKSVCASL